MFLIKAALTITSQKRKLSLGAGCLHCPRTVMGNQRIGGIATKVVHSFCLPLFNRARRCSSSRFRIPRVLIRHKSWFSHKFFTPCCISTVYCYCENQLPCTGEGYPEALTHTGKSDWRTKDSTPPLPISDLHSYGSWQWPSVFTCVPTHLDWKAPWAFRIFTFSLMSPIFLKTGTVVVVVWDRRGFNQIKASRGCLSEEGTHPWWLVWASIWRD